MIEPLDNSAKSEAVHPTASLLLIRQIGLIGLISPIGLIGLIGVMHSGEVGKELGTISPSQLLISFLFLINKTASMLCDRIAAVGLKYRLGREGVGCVKVGKS